MKSVGVVPLLATAAFAGDRTIDKDVPLHANNTDSSCGNCWMRSVVWSPSQGMYVEAPAGVGGISSYMCVTGLNAEAVNQGTNDAPYIPTEANTTATAWTIQRIKDAFALDPKASFDHLFCAEYLSQYKDGRGHNSTTGDLFNSWYVAGEKDDPDKVAYGPDGPGYVNGDWGYPDRAGTGAACVRAKTVDAIIEADREVYAEWLKYGSSGKDAAGGEGHEGGPEGVPNGYASGYAINSGPPNWQYRKWGTGYYSGSDLPANWCKSQMKQMLCHIAFPQVKQISASADNNVLTDTDRALGMVRSVDYSSCKSIMQTCVRRQPSGNETNSDYIAPEFASTLGQFLMRNDTADIKGDKELQCDRPCDFWRIGLGIAKAGTGVGHNENEGDMAQFGSAARVSVGYLVALILLVAGGI